ncbi:MAG: hypothetical protein IH614_00375 [Desulfuromonadales bacterium]|nr:hypothetical protein [Desulfuromonadales bacterium]
MDPWQSILLALGGNAALLLILGWLARSLGSQLLARDLAKFKAGLESATTDTTERLRHDLQLAALEHQVRFSKLHDRRARVIAEVYGLLVEAHWASQSFVALAEFGGEPSKQEKYIAAMNKAADFYRYFDKNRIYLPEALCTQLEQFNKDMRGKVIGFGVFITHDSGSSPPHFTQQKLDAWIKASEYFDKEIPIARAALEGELRGILAARSTDAA